MPFRVYLVEPPTLLDDLLEDSDRFYHRCVALIQRVIHKEWTKTFQEHLARERLARPDESPGAAEARVLDRLRGYRARLRRERDELIREQQHSRDERDRAIRSHVARGR